MSVVLAIAPYQILPADTGERNAVAGLYDAIGKYAECHVVSIADNGANNKHSFHLHRSLSNRVFRYLPKHSISVIGAIARKIKATHIICDHPYLAPAAWHVSWEYGAPWYLRAHRIEREHYRQLGKWWSPAMGLFEQHWMRKANGIFFTTNNDLEWAIKHYKVRRDVCHVAPFGIALGNAPSDKARAKQWIAAEHQVNPAMPWLYFIGALGYRPNSDAVRYIINEIAPRLEATGQRLKILIGGKGLPDEIEDEIGSLTRETIHYLGFIENLDFFLKGCDMMLNPILAGAGIKTKVIEALGYNKTVVSTVKGAEGIIREVCGDNLLLTDNGDWDTFTRQIVHGLTIDPHIPGAFYDMYHWNNIARNMLEMMNAL